jgi:YHS domain-containing protein
VRAVVLALALAVVLVALLRALRGALPPAPPRRVTSDELVKDPVCQTYIVRSRAVGRQTTAGPRYFCSADCASRFSG